MDSSPGCSTDQTPGVPNDKHTATGPNGTQQPMAATIHSKKLKGQMVHNLKQDNTRKASSSPKFTAQNGRQAQLSFHET